MALDIPVSVMLRRIGHDGGAVVDESSPEPLCRRGFHVQECVAVAISLGFSATPVELFPSIRCCNNQCFPVLFGTEAKNWERFQSLIDTHAGVITGRGKRCPHAVAFANGTIFDPDGHVYPYCRAFCEARGFYTQCLWLVQPSVNRGVNV